MEWMTIIHEMKTTPGISVTARGALWLSRGSFEMVQDGICATSARFTAPRAYSPCTQRK